MVQLHRNYGVGYQGHLVRQTTRVQSSQPWDGMACRESGGNRPSGYEQPGPCSQACAPRRFRTASSIMPPLRGNRAAMFQQRRLYSNIPKEDGGKAERIYVRICTPYSAPMHMSCKLRLGNAIVQEWVSRPFRTRTNCEFRLRHVCVSALMATKFGVSTSLFESGSVLLASQASSNSCLSLEVPIPWGIRTPYVVMGAPRQPFLHNLIVSHAMMQLTRSSETWTSNSGL